MAGPPNWEEDETLIEKKVCPGNDEGRPPRESANAMKPATKPFRTGEAMPSHCTVAAGRSAPLWRRQDGYTAPTAEDRAVQAALDLLAEYGYGIAMRCLDCHRPITAKVSLARMRGPRCAAKAVN